jgi:hypothetical protein
VGTSFNSISELDQHSIIIHEFLHMLLNIDERFEHAVILSALGVSSSGVAALLLDGGDPLTSFIRRDCEVP